MNYEDFLSSKVVIAKQLGFDCDLSEINPMLKPFQRLAVQWAVRMGRAALFERFGLGKTIQQLEIVRIIAQKAGGKGLIVLPLGVRQEFYHDAEMLGIKVKFIRRIEEAFGADIYLTNYETVRDGKMDPREFTVASLDEAACLRGFGGTKTFREFMGLFAGDYKTMDNRVLSDGVRYRFVATATPSPNDYIELLAYSAFLGVMDVSAAKTRFFKRDSTKADALTIHPHKEREFWLWCASWALFIQKPSDLDDSDEGYDLPPLHVHWHEIETDHDDAGAEAWGQTRLFKGQAIGVTEASREKRSSLDRRVKKAIELIPGGGTQFIAWVDLNDEQAATERALAAAGVSYSSLYGSQDIDEREDLIADWKACKTRCFLSKPMMYGAGINMQQCSDMIFVGIGFKFADCIQAVHRIYRFMQVNECNVHLIYTEAEREVRRTLERKWAQHNEAAEKMAAIMREYGLSKASLSESMRRKMGVQRTEVCGRNFRLINNDCVPEVASMEEASVDLILTSIPFSTQYEYSPNFADFGHTDNNAHFFEQMDYLTPELLRVLRPGRIAAIHVKDRIIPGGMTGLGFQTVYPFHMKTTEHFCKHGFAYMGMKTIVTDVVRENNQTYRLGWTEQCKDGTKMGVGMPEYLLLFRKPPTENINSYADKPVIKEKAKYSRSRWQIDAHGFARSSGNRLMSSEELKSLPHEAIFKLFRAHSLGTVYNYEEHVSLGEELEARKRLPVTFMLLQPQSWSDDVWTDITRMLTLNGMQHAKGREMHLCPMQWDLADRVIEQMTMAGETVLDPFGGLMTVPYRAILKGRKGIGIELSTPYFLDGLAYCQSAEKQMSIPDLFSAIEEEEHVEERTA